MQYLATNMRASGFTQRNKSRKPDFDRLTVKENEIFETVIHQDPYRRHTASQPPNN
jgi:hypothetical protein